MSDYRPPADKVRESRLRRRAARLDHRLLRSRAKKLHLNNRGLYQLVNYNNTVVEGPNFEADLHDIEAALERIEARRNGDRDA